MKKRIVVTGIGVLASTGVGKDKVWEGLRKGASGIDPVTLFDTLGLNSHLAGEIKDFDPKEILGKKGLRNLDRTTLLALSASKLALDDARLETPVSEEDTDDFGVSLGTTMGSVWSISEFDKTGLIEGPRAVNPALFPNTVINSPASHISIKFNIKGFNATISTGFTSGLDSIFYAMNMMELYGYHTVLAGGVEELCEQTYKGFHKIGHLAGSRKGTEEINCPFDKRRNGIVLGEGAGVMVLEELAHAKARGAEIYGEILGYGAGFDPDFHDMYNPQAKGATRSMEMAIKSAGILPEDIGYIASSANSTLDCDVMEARAIRKVFGDRIVSVSSIKSMLGETFSASGAMNLVSGLGVLTRHFIPPTINYEVEDRRCAMKGISNITRETDTENILVNSFSPTGSNSSLVVAKGS